MPQPISLAFDMASVYPEPLEYCSDIVDVEDSTALEPCIIEHAKFDTLCPNLYLPSPYVVFLH